MSDFTQQSVQANGGVAWAKQVAAAMDLGAIGVQIQGYQRTADSMAHVASTLRTVKGNLAATWEGDAAEQAQMAFQSSIDHAQQIHDTIADEVILPLRTAEYAQNTFVHGMAEVPDEKAVPSTNDLEKGWDYFSGQATPTQLVEAHNIQARYKAAEALNTLSVGYGDAATKLNAVASKQDKFTENSGSGAFDLGPVTASSGNGSASTYSQGIHGGSTTTSGYVGASGSHSTSSIAARSQSSTSTHLVSPDPTTVVAGLGATTADSPGVGGLVTDEPIPGASHSDLGMLPGASGGVFGDTGLGEGVTYGGKGSSLRPGGTSGDDGESLGDGHNVGRGSSTASADEASEVASGEAGERGATGIFEDEDELGSSQYSRGRYFDFEEDEGVRGLPPVRSVYEDATDAQGNKLNLLAPTRRAEVQVEDHERERARRPLHLKEDEHWDSAQRIVPPVIR